LDPNLVNLVSRLILLFGGDFFGFADTTAAKRAIELQGGELVSGYPRAISIGIALPGAIVDMLPMRSEPGVAVSYRVHCYEVINTRLDLISSSVAGLLQRHGYRALPLPASERIDDVVRASPDLPIDLYAVRRSDYLEDPSITGHDFGLPFRMVQRKRRAVFEPRAVALEKESRDLEDEFGRKVRMITRALRHVYSGSMLHRVPPVYALELFSHRLLRYETGILHLIALGTNAALVGQGLIYQITLGLQLAWLLLATFGRLRIRVPGAGIAYYYLLVTLATLVGNYRFLRFGTPTTWEKAEGTR